MAGHGAGCDLTRVQQGHEEAYDLGGIAMRRIASTAFDWGIETTPVDHLERTRLAIRDQRLVLSPGGKARLVRSIRLISPAVDEALTYWLDATAPTNDKLVQKCMLDADQTCICT